MLDLYYVMEWSGHHSSILCLRIEVSGRRYYQLAGKRDGIVQNIKAGEVRLFE